MNGYCECCENDPCDCHGVTDELWRMDQTECDPGGKNTCLASAANRDQPESGQSLEKRQHSKNTVLSEDLQSDSKAAEQANPRGYIRRGFLYRGFF
jgi:hypothetical protein